MLRGEAAITNVIVFGLTFDRSLGVKQQSLTQVNIYIFVFLFDLMS
jgi:hypothetical protein